MCYFFQMANMQHYNNPLIKKYVSYVSDHMKYMNVKNLLEEIWRKICELFQVTNIMNIKWYKHRRMIAGSLNICHFLGQTGQPYNNKINLQGKAHMHPFDSSVLLEVYTLTNMLEDNH